MSGIPRYEMRTGVGENGSAWVAMDPSESGTYVTYADHVASNRREYTRGLRAAWDAVRLIHGTTEHACTSEAECYTIDGALGHIAKLFPCRTCGGGGSGCTCEKESV